mmetsp:Transcript_17706/g.50170  ORF Transcript_17706/g.50170 Transcript_17706/m.50170 type:complete len:208 (-) Transcript_17706:78-701(-)
MIAASAGHHGNEGCCKPHLGVRVQRKQHGGEHGVTHDACSGPLVVIADGFALRQHFMYRHGAGLHADLDNLQRIGHRHLRHSGQAARQHFAEDREVPVMALDGHASGIVDAQFDRLLGRDADDVHECPAVQCQRSAFTHDFHGGIHATLVSCPALIGLQLRLNKVDGIGSDGTGAARGESACCVDDRRGEHPSVHGSRPEKNSRCQQ